ncbi:small ribosomal subunit protein mL103 (rPPR7)-like [Magnolia sinica]|uniref:small ribosomal subunit protein mL103 (rPPR7)-like n=1 Tax=Magnolia sinica TaxID=86752 RepID=UPI0026595A83|nr:small ribosomal subunit protein mL103 (rPPR7)-like [Magnolia sinica]
MTTLSSSLNHFLPRSRLLSTTTTATATSRSISISRAKSKLRSEHDPDKALAVYSSVVAHLQSPVASRYALDLTVRRLAKSHRYFDIESLVESQKSDPKITQEPFLLTLILTYGRAGMLDQAIQNFQQLDSLGTSRSAVSSRSVRIDG